MDRKELEERLASLSPEEQRKEAARILGSLSKEERENLLGACPFCLIAQGRIEAYRVYEDEDMIAVLDINPASYGHMLVFTKEHKGSIWEINEKEFTKLLKISHKIANALKVLSNDISIIIQSGKNAGQTSPHILINIIPRYEDDGLVVGWKGKKADKGELEECAKKIIANLPKEEPEIIKETKDIKLAEEEEERIP
ncbi:HIT family protein [archaeon]|nr:HIT family protein [archaeon]